MKGCAKLVSHDMRSGGQASLDIGIALPENVRDRLGRLYMRFGGIYFVLGAVLAAPGLASAEQPPTAITSAIADTTRPAADLERRAFNRTHIRHP